LSRQRADFAQCQHERTALAASVRATPAMALDGQRGSVNQSSAPGAFQRFQRELERNGRELY